MSADPEPEVKCPHCDEPVDVSDAREHRGVGRAGCRRCGVQLVRRGDGPWETIRG